MKKALVFIMLFLLCVHNVSAASRKKCPAGLFCVNNGMYVPDDTYGHDIRPYQMGPSELVVSGWGMWSDEQLCDKCDDNDSSCAYCASDYDELWVSTWFGFYMVKKGEVTYHSARSSTIQGVFACPGTYPSSEEGASSVFDCYRIISNGKKEYYKAPDNKVNDYDGSYNTDDINSAIANLESVLEQARVAARNLQNVLKKSNSKIQAHFKNDMLTSVSTPVQINGVLKEEIMPTVETVLMKKTQTDETELTETKTESTLNGLKKQIDFGSLISVFADRAAVPVDNPTVRSAASKEKTITRSAIDKEKANVRSAIKKEKTVKRSVDNVRQDTGQTKKKQRVSYRQGVATSR